MKKIFLILLSCMIYTATYSKDNLNNESGTDKSGGERITINHSSKNINGITLFVNQVNTFTTEDWKALAESKITDFVIIPLSAKKYGSTESGYKTQLAPIIINTINQLIKYNKTAKIWIGTPGSLSEIADRSFIPISNYIAYIREQIGNQTWKRNIRGIYISQEAIMGPVDYTNLRNNNQINLFYELSSMIHNKLRKEFLWIPYYGYGSNPTHIIKDIGYLADQADIFDYVVIQPHYYFDGTVQANLDGVYNSVKNQNVCYRDGKPVTPKKSKSVIGVEMELDWHIVPSNEQQDRLGRYLEYVEKYKEFKDSNPVIFYWDGNIQNALKERINPFY